MNKFILIVIALVLISSQAFKTRMQMKTSGGYETSTTFTPSALSSASPSTVATASSDSLQNILTESGYQLTNEAFQQFDSARVQKPIV